MMQEMLHGARERELVGVTSTECFLVLSSFKRSIEFVRFGDFVNFTQIFVYCIVCVCLS